MTAGKDNLIPLSERTKAEQREIARKGGKASAKARQKKRTAQEAARFLLNMPAPDTAADLIRQYGIADADQTNMIVLIARMIQLAQSGDIKAAQFVIDLLGESLKNVIYEKRLELLKVQSGFYNQSIVDDWVTSIPDAEDIET